METTGSIDTALDNLSAIKSGETVDVSLGPKDDPLRIAREETDRLWREHNLHTFVIRDNVHVATARWRGKNGTCKYNTIVTKNRYGERVSKTQTSVGEYSIVINERIIDDTGVDEFIDTVRHEAAHVVAYCDASAGPHGTSPGHSEGWKKWARKLGADPSPCHNKKETDYRYWYGCPNGCWESGRIVKSTKITSPGKKRKEDGRIVGRICTQCGDRCVSWRDGEHRPTDPGVRFDGAEEYWPP